MARAQAEHGKADTDTPPIDGLLGRALPSLPAVEVFLWPDNRTAWALWCELQTQWRTGVEGATGMDYAAVLAFLREQGLRGAERRDVFAGIRAAEYAVLDFWAERREQERERAKLGG